MSKLEDLHKFTNGQNQIQGKILSTTPRWDDIRDEGGNPIRTIKLYYPSDKLTDDYLLTLQIVEDETAPANSQEYIMKYIAPFGADWKNDAVSLLQKYEFEYDGHAKHQCLIARNVKDVRIGQPAPNNWEIEEFIITVLLGGQLAVWTKWEKKNDNGDPTETYRAGYVWPSC